jgi:hypothetical protein
MPGGFGLGRNVKQCARMGYVALAGDPYGGESRLTTSRKMMKRVTDL